MARKGLYTLGLAATALTVGCGAPTANDASRSARLKTVDIPQTAVKNQDAAGFCWAYAIAGFLESKYKSETKSQINLSEEALAFYRVVDELSFYANAFASDAQVTLPELTEAVRGSEFQGWILRRGPDVKDMRDAYELVETYGALPETAWNVKFTDSTKTARMVRRVQDGFLTLVKSKGRTSISEAELIQVVGKAFGSVPPSKFVFNGNEISARDFARDVLKFRADDYVLVEAETSRDVEKILTATKMGLSQGLSIPVGFGVNFSLLKKGTFSYANKTHEFYDGIDKERARKFFGSDGGHAVLVTDFVNVGGHEGSVSDATLRAEVAKPIESLQYLKVKNSWGTSASNNERGTALEGTLDGYYRLDLGYLKGEADGGFLSVVVPKDIAAAL